MKLYFSPGACSLAPHIVLEEMGAKYDAVKVDLAKKTCEEGDFNKINPKGYVPALIMENGQLLTEDAVILQYLADLKPEAGLIPATGTLERYRFMETLHFISTELHKGFSPLFGAERMMQNPEGIEQFKNSTKSRLGTRFEMINHMLSEKPYIAGEKFTVADAYLFVILNWAQFMKVDTKPFPKMQAYYQTLLKRPSVQKAMTAEGLQ
jgi:glutathione S-transferase